MSAEDNSSAAKKEIRRSQERRMAYHSLVGFEFPLGKLR